MENSTFQILVLQYNISPLSESVSTDSYRYETHPHHLPAHKGSKQVKQALKHKTQWLA